MTCYDVPIRTELLGSLDVVRVWVLAFLRFVTAAETVTNSRSPFNKNLGLLTFSNNFGIRGEPLSKICRTDSAKIHA